MMYRLTGVLLMVFLSGCVLTENTREVDLLLPALELQDGSPSGIVVGVLDERAYVTSGEKPAK